MDYDHIQSAHPPLRDRMLYGLNKIAYFINAGVSHEESYFINCDNFENLIENVYNGEYNLLFDVLTEIVIKLRLKILSISAILIMNGSYRKPLQNLRIM